MSFNSDDDYDDNIDDLKVNELKIVLKIFHLPINGTKKELVNRLRGYFESFNVKETPQTSQSSISNLKSKIRTIYFN